MCSTLNYEIIIVEDSSPDGTYEVNPIAVLLVVAEVLAITCNKSLTVPLHDRSRVVCGVDCRLQSSFRPSTAKTRSIS